MSRHPYFRIRRGLSLVEAMISLVITAMLLTAVAAAFTATTAAIDANDEFFRASQAARVAVNRIVTDVRRCTSGTVASNTITLVEANGNRSYGYNSSTQKLTMTAGGTTSTLASNVSSATFSSDGSTISMTIIVTHGTNQITLCGSAMPRKTILFN